MVKKFKELFENNDNIYDVKSYNTKFEIDIKDKFGEVIEDFKSWCFDNNIKATHKMVEKVLEISKDDIIYYNQSFEMSYLYEEFDFNEYYEKIIKENFPLVLKSKEFNL